METQHKEMDMEHEHEHATLASKTDMHEKNS
jgi:hypothetical protein